MRSAAPAVEGAEVPDAAADEVAELEPVVALEVARVDPEPVAAVPLAAVSVGTTTDEPLATGAVPVAAALVTVGTEAAGVTWIWPSENCETGTRVEVGATLVMEAQGVVPTCTWPEKKKMCEYNVLGRSWAS